MPKIVSVPEILENFFKGSKACGGKICHCQVFGSWLHLMMIRVTIVTIQT